MGVRRVKDEDVEYPHALYLYVDARKPMIPSLDFAPRSPPPIPRKDPTGFTRHAQYHEQERTHDSGIDNAGQPEILRATQL